MRSKELLGDLRAYGIDANNPASSGLALAARALVLQRLQAVVLFRFAQGLQPHVAILVKALNQFLTGADLASSAVVGAGLQLFHPFGVVIGPFVVIGDRARIMQGVTLGHGRGGSPTIGDDVFIGANAVIVGGITIGDRVSIGANSVVTFDVPSDSLVRAPKATTRSISRPSPE